MAKLKRSNEHKTFTEIEQLFDERKDALEFLFVVHSFGCSEKEMKEKRKYLDYQLQEAEYDASLALLGAIEAAFRLDFDYRRKRRLKDSRSKAVRQASGFPRDDFDYRISITKLFDILANDHSADHSTTNPTIDLLKVYFKYRNWLAHGRYWQLRLGINRPTFSDIFQAAKTIKNLLNG